MRRLQLAARFLAAVLLALLARIVVDGLEAVSAVSALVIGGLLLATVSLRREARRLDPDLADQGGRGDA